MVAEIQSRMQSRMQSKDGSYYVLRIGLGKPQIGERGVSMAIKIKNKKQYKNKKQ